MESLQAVEFEQGNFMNPFRRFRHQMELRTDFKKMEREASEAEAGPRLHWQRASRIFGSVISVLAIMLLAAVIYVAMNFSSLSKTWNAKSERVPDGAVSDFEWLLKKGSYGDLVSYAAQNQADAASSLPEQLDALKKQIAIADRIIDIDAQSSSTPTTSTPHLVKIGAIMNLERLHQQHQLDNEFVEHQVDEYVVPLLSNSNPEIAGSAHACVCYSRCLRFHSTRSDEDFAKMRRRCMDSVSFAIESPATMKKLFKILSLIELAAPDGERNKQLLIELAEKMNQSSQPSIRTIGAELQDKVLVAGRDLNLLASGVLLHDAEAIAGGIDFINDVAEESRYSENGYSAAIQMAELVERMGHHEALEPAIEKLVQSVAQVRPVESQPIIQQAIGDFLQRKQLAGKPFRLELTKSTGADLSSCTGNVVVIIFYDSSPQSTAALEATGQLEYFAAEGVSFIAIELGNPENSADQNELAKAREELRIKFPGFIFLQSGEAHELFAQCPVRTGPYLVVLNRNHEVIVTNANPDTLRVLLKNSTSPP